MNYSLNVWLIVALELYLLGPDVLQEGPIPLLLEVVTYSIIGSHYQM